MAIQAIMMVRGGPSNRFLKDWTEHAMRNRIEPIKKAAKMLHRYDRPRTGTLVVEIDRGFRYNDVGLATPGSAERKRASIIGWQLHEQSIPRYS